ncbi:MAG: hypothetical protein KY437_00670 [Actinobacteria bacterium]|nr:hypothetical protein [Actinomycetota bacterium]
MSAMTNVGRLPCGAVFAYAIPDGWNGTLLVYSRPVPAGPDDPPWTAQDPLVTGLVDHGYAVTGVSNTIFWPLEHVFAATPELLDGFAADVGAADRTVGFGLSIGGLIVAGLVQRFSGMLTAALAMCGNLAGAVVIHNRELDIAFVVRTLLAGGRDLEVACISDADVNLRTAEAILAEARDTAQGRARLSLAAAVGDIPAWFDPAAPEPGPTDRVERLWNQVAWFHDPGFLVYFGMRSDVERQAAGNPSWNTGVDYAQRLERSDRADLVAAWYDAAGLPLERDLEDLAAAPRIVANPHAVSCLEDHIVLDGQLHGTPVLTVHTVGDGLVTPVNEHAYRDVVRWAGDHELLRQLYIHRGGHCSFTFAETLTALDLLTARSDRRDWPPSDAESLCADAAGRGDGANTLASGTAAAPGFVTFEPDPFSRQYDVRDVGSRTGQERSEGS